MHGAAVMIGHFLFDYSIDRVMDTPARSTVLRDIMLLEWIRPNFLGPSTLSSPNIDLYPN